MLTAILLLTILNTVLALVAVWQLLTAIVIGSTSQNVQITLKRQELVKRQELEEE